MSEEITVPEPSAFTPRSIEDMLATLDADTPADTLLAIHERLKFYEKEGKRLRKIAEDKLIASCEKHGDIEIGNGRRYYAGYETDTDCPNKAKTVEAILEASGGDFAALVECLSSNAILSGKAKNVLGEELYAQHFTKTRKAVLKDGAAAPKKLMVADQRFTKRKAHAPDTSQGQ